MVATTVVSKLVDLFPEFDEQDHAIARVFDAPRQAAPFTSSAHQGHCRPAQRGLVSAALRELFNATDAADSWSSAVPRHRLGR